MQNKEEETFMSKGILIVDDAAFMRMMIKDVLTKNGLEVVGEIGRASCRERV